MFFSLLYVFIVILNATFLCDDSGCKDKSFFLINKELALFLSGTGGGMKITITLFPVDVRLGGQGEACEAGVCKLPLICSALRVVEREFRFSGKMLMVFGKHRNGFIKPSA